MERLRENNFLMSAIAISTAVVVALSFGLSSDLSNTFEIIEFPEEVIIEQIALLANFGSIFFQNHSN